MKEKIQLLQKNKTKYSKKQEGTGFQIKTDF